MSQLVSFQVHRVRVDQATEWLFLRLTTEAGYSGFGEPMLGGREDLLFEALALAASRLVGTDCLVARAPVQVLADDQASGLLEATVRSAIDQCLWDLRGQEAGLPVCRLAGPQLRDQFQLYANINRGTRNRSPAGFAERAGLAVEAGFHAVKIAPFDGVTRATLQTPAGRAALETGIERIHAVRAAIGDESTLMVDCHCRLDLPAALRVIDATKPIRLDWLEDALLYQDRDGWGRLRAASPARLIGGETARGVSDLLPFLREGIWDVVMPDVRFFGGITELLAVEPLCVQHQVSLSPHNPRGPVGTLASAHAMASSHAFSMLEFQFGECDWRSQLVGGAERIEGGKLLLSHAPGLGIDWQDAPQP